MCVCERREGMSEREVESGSGGGERKGRSESEEDREKLGLLAHHSLLITWLILAFSFNFGT